MSASPRVLALHVAARHGEKPEPAESAALEVGRGVVGDRHDDGTVTLIGAEALEALANEHGIALEPGADRRNVVVEGVELDGLVGRRFRLGTAWLEGVEPCPPCRRLEKLTQPGVMRGLAGRGGLRARVITAGTVRAGDSLEVGE